ncbi:hypothetical protein EDC01DRAFT_636176 [Geopyxis carbonaria]|nr:hypothetical protein EDC01DRAFT_636176 [Geopyxis carbonaria]
MHLPQTQKYKLKPDRLFVPVPIPLPHLQSAHHSISIFGFTKLTHTSMIIPSDIAAKMSIPSSVAATITSDYLPPSSALLFELLQLVQILSLTGGGATASPALHARRLAAHESFGEQLVDANVMLWEAIEPELDWLRADAGHTALWAPVGSSVWRDHEALERARGLLAQVDARMLAARAEWGVREWIVRLDEGAQEVGWEEMQEIFFVLWEAPRGEGALELAVKVRARLTVMEGEEYRELWKERGEFVEQHRMARRAAKLRLKEELQQGGDDDSCAYLED